MGFSTVYGVLQELFPQVDTRALRAVAIEHSKDADAAVEAVLLEVIPYLNKGNAAPCSSNDSAVETLQTDFTCLNETNGTVNDANVGGGEVGDEELVSLQKHENGVTVGVIIEPDVTSHVTSTTMVHESADDHCNEVRVNTENGEIISLGESSSVEVSFEPGSHVLSTISNRSDNGNSSITNGNQLAEWEDCDGPAACDDLIIHGESCLEQLCLDGNKLDLEFSVVQLVPLPANDCTIGAPEGSLQFEDFQLLNSVYEKPERSYTPNAAEPQPAPNEDRSTTETVDFNDDSTLNDGVTRSGQICRIDLLDETIEDAKNNKKALFSAMESVLSLMREVELQEKAAEEAKEGAVLGGLDIISEVEHLKQMLQHAREANEMQAGSVYGEKAILATEARGLQSRLLSLSNERDKSLAILDQMRETLEERFDAAEKARKEAEQEKLEKVESARNVLAEQKLIMEKVVEESKLLEQLKEENSKLDEFLKDRGCVVDMLQGEISVICQDVKLLKEKFDERVPLSKSVSSSQTSCILASSSSSLKSMSPEHVSEQAESSETPKNPTPRTSADDRLSSGEEGEENDRKALVDDGWEFFDRE